MPLPNSENPLILLYFAATVHRSGIPLLPMANIANLLKSTPSGIDFEVCFVAPVTNFPKKDGGTYEAQECQIKTRSNGEMYSARLFPSFISKFGIKAGSLLHGAMGTNGYTQWTPVDTTEAGLATQPKPYQSIKAEQRLKEAKDEEVAKWDRISTGKCIFGFLQTFIEQGKTISEAKTLAIEAVDAMETAVDEYISIYRSKF